MFTRCAPLLLAALMVLAATGAPVAYAETVRLRSGKPLDATSVEFLDGKIQATLARDGGTARVLLRFDQLDARDVLPLWDRTHARDDAAAALASAELALALGQRAEAARRYQLAARLDATFDKRRDAGLARLRGLEATDAMADLESRVRQGSDPRGAVILSEALLEGPHATALRPAEIQRVWFLGTLAERLIAREAARAAKADTPADTPADAGAPAAAALPGAPAAPAAPVAPAGPGSIGDAPLAAIRERVGAFAARASVAREAAADPKVRPRRALELLSRAADAYRLARRLVREAPDALALELGELGDDLRLALVTTYLDLADLYRQEGRYDEARAHVRAALILDPGNEEAWSQRRLIEDDLNRELTPAEDVYRPAVEFFYASPSPFYYGYGRRYYARPVLYGHHGGQRVVGRRR